MTPRLAVVASHPIQYQAPLWRLLAARGVVDPTVFFLSDHGVEASFDPGLGREVRFDVPLVEGYRHEFVPNRSRRPSVNTFTGTVNPGIVRALRTGGFDAVLVQGYAQASLWLAYATALADGLPLLLRGETPDPPPEARQGARWLARRAVLGTLVRRSRACLAIGLRNGAYYASMGARPDQIVWAPYSVDDVGFAAGGAEGRAGRAARLSALGLDPAEPVVLFGGKLISRKRPEDVVHAVDRLDRDVSLVIVGDGELRDTIADLARTRPRMRSVGFVNQREIAQWFGVADLFVVPSERETWGLVVNEAMAAGAVPIVSDAVGCAPDLVAGGAGGIFPVGDVDALADRIRGLLEPGRLDAARVEGAGRIRRYGLAATAAGIEDAVVGP